MRRLLILLALLLALLALPLLLRRSSPPAVYDLAVFNTLGRLSLWNVDRRNADRIARDAIAELQNLHRILNLFDPESEVSRLNQTPPGEYFKCSEPLWQILLTAREAQQLTKGAFDITIGPLMRLWGFHRKRDSLPAPEEIQSVLANVGFDKLLFDEENQRVAFSRPGMSVDFGGLAKGFALDWIRPLIEKQGCYSYMLDLGGNIYCSAEPPSGRRQFFQIGIRDPADPDKILQTVALRDRYISTSANYERALFIGEKKIGHLLNPQTGYPVELRSSVTVITCRGSYSDVFSTAVFVAGEELARQLSKQIPGTEFIILP
ncbi:MAG: FAD:protein FMN transferase [Lentisphaeria bacterium]